MREGVGGYPLVLLHGYPETKRIWWRNIAPLAAAGYEVIVPDLRGHGESDVDPDDRYDIVTYSRDVEALVHDVLGHERCGVVAGDVGAVVAYDLALRFEGLVEALCCFNTAPPFLIEEYQAAGIVTDRVRATSTPGRRPTTSSARARSPTPWPPSSTPPSAGAATSPTSTATACGPAGARSPRPTSTS